MSSKEFTYWLAFDRISPGEPERDDLRTALIASVIANCNRGKGRKFTIDDFLLKFKPSPKLRTPKNKNEIKTKLMSWLAMNKHLVKKD